MALWARTGSIWLEWVRGGSGLRRRERKGVGDLIGIRRVRPGKVGLGLADGKIMVAK